MTAKEALIILDRFLQTQALTQIQEFVFYRAWEGDSYGLMAEVSGYDEDYIKAIGARLWKTISQLLGIKVSKNNLISAFEQYARNARGQANETSFNTPSGRDDVERIDWGEAPAIAAFYGRQTELTQLTK